MEVTKIKWGEYEVKKNGNKAIVKFDRHGEYNLADGKYHPAWLFCYGGKEFICIDKKHAFEMAETRL